MSTTSAATAADFTALNQQKVAKSSGTGNSTSSTATNSTSDANSADRFLKLLVAQMKNQDPLNPLDNAQVTSQLAQINTVSGINQLNSSVTGLSSQFLQQQALQAVSLVGRDVIVPGNRVTVANDSGIGGFELATPADRVQLQVYKSDGTLINTTELGAGATGSHSFNWPAKGHLDAENLTFKIVASQGTNAVAATPLMTDRVAAVATGQDQLTLDLEHAGSTPYTTIKAFN